MTVRKPFFVEPIALGTIATGNELATNPASHLARPDAMGLTWKSSNNANLWVRGDLGSAQPIDFCALISANALPGTQILLRLGDSQAEVDGIADYASGVLPFISPSITRPDGLYHSHLELPAVQTKRWWRIDIAGHTGQFEAATLVLGKRLEPSRFYDHDFDFGLDDTGKGEFTQTGVWDANPGVILRTVSFVLNWQTRTEYEDTFRPFAERLGTNSMVYMCFDPEPTTWRQQQTYLGVMKKPGYATGRRNPRLISQEYEIRSMI